MSKFGKNHTIKFFKGKLKEAQENAQELKKHEVLSKVDHVIDQLNQLKCSYREFIFSYLHKMFGSVKAQDYMQSEVVINRINNFTELTNKDIGELTESTSSDTKSHLMNVLKRGYVEIKSPEEVRTSCLKNLENMPDLLSRN